MRATVFAMRDVVAGQYLHPFLAPAVGVAIRMFGDSIRDSSTPMAKHPSDYQLFQIGVFDDETAALEAEVPVLISRGSDFVEASASSQLRAVS